METISMQLETTEKRDKWKSCTTAWWKSESNIQSRSSNYLL